MTVARIEPIQHPGPVRPLYRRAAVLSAFLIALVTTFQGTSFAAWEVRERETLPASGGLQFDRLSLANGQRRAELHILLANPAAHSLRVIDNPDGRARLSSAAQQTALAGVNGGYFHPDRTPLGLVIANGQTLHGFERARLLSGIVLATPKRISLLRASEYKASGSVRAALQAGPFLVDGGKPVAGLNDSRSAARTVVFTGDTNVFGIALCGPVTLAEAAQLLDARDLLPGLSIARALNLDGGSSSGLWVRRDSGPAFYQPEFKTVRNYLVIVPK